ncbi:hypothetical protein AciX9_4083 (plasmid) [Granulicella tundricola MP5ACTX9]|uniref:Uncharacterized protein n=1 Tax=Granulicella tundricola (strain ATCC BAA-1859 / DSM 23138 / MP5ACTX9) TaxID=1198114 RepID=E8X5Y2_GRATM|nr:hypothetical protein AciX9_4083 [Granulicella tundricola MP5ACTX9]
MQAPDPHQLLRQLSATWQKVRIPAGKTVELMHFVSQEVLRSAGIAAAQRLIQLPPEALAGLTTTDATAIQNFSVPQNLTSALAALLSSPARSPAAQSPETASPRL